MSHPTILHRVALPYYGSLDTLAALIQQSSPATHIPNEPRSSTQSIHKVARSIPTGISTTLTARRVKYAHEIWVGEY
jgi:hypothetical protein